MKYFLIISVLLFSLNSVSIIEEDDRLYIHGTNWNALLDGIVQIQSSKGSCTGFILEGDVVITAAHCLQSIYNEEGEEVSVFNDYNTVNYNRLKNVLVYVPKTSFYFNPKHQLIRSQIDLEGYHIKDIYLPNHSNCEKSTNQEFVIKDYALIKLHGEIGEHVKRFNLLKPELLKDYDILGDPYKGKLVTAGYHGDRSHDVLKLAHIGCKIRDTHFYNQVQIGYTDCDVIEGASGSPLFYILRHKKTKYIKLAVKGILSHASIFKQSRRYSPDNENKVGRKLGFGPSYFQHGMNYGINSTYISLTNYKEFLNILEKFKSNSHQFRGKVMPTLERHPYFNKKWLLENIVHKKSEAELEDFLKEQLENKDPYINCRGDDVGYFLAILGDYHLASYIPFPNLRNLYTLMEKRKISLAKSLILVDHLHDYIALEQEISTIPIRKKSTFKNVKDGFLETQSKRIINFFSVYPEEILETDEDSETDEDPKDEDPKSDVGKAIDLWDLYFNKEPASDL